MTSQEHRMTSVVSTPGYDQNSTSPEVGNGTRWPSEPYDDLIAHAGVRYTLIAVHISLSFVAVIGNAVVLIVIYKRQSLRRNPTIIFIINLAFCDLIQVAFYRPLLLVELFMPFTEGERHEYQYSEKYCKTMSFFQCLFAAVGFHTIVAISQERLCLIVYPLKAKHWFSTSRARKLLVLIWILSACSIVPIPIMFAKVISRNIGGSLVKYCGLFSTNTSGVVYFISMTIIYFVTPMIVLSVSYSKIFFALYHRHRSLDAVHEKKDFRTLRLRRNLAKMMVAVAVIFMMCWGPHFIFFTYAGLGGIVPSNGFFTATIMDFLPIVSSCLNPFVYTINSKTFRKGLSSMVLRSSSSRRSYFESMQNTFGAPYYRSSVYDGSDSSRGDRNTSLIGKRTNGDVMM